MQDRSMGGDHSRYLIDNLLEWKYGNAVYYTAALLLFFIIMYGLITRGDVLRAQWGFFALAVAMLPALAEYLTPVIFPWPMKFFIALSLILHIAGGTFEYYFTFYPIYDKIGHLVASMAIALILFVTLLILVGVTGIHLSRPAVVFGIFITVMVLAAGWEYAELNIDVVAGSTYFVDASDSLFDMLFNLIGTCYIVANINEYLKHESINSLYQRFIRWKT